MIIGEELSISLYPFFVLFVHIDMIDCVDSGEIEIIFGCRNIEMKRSPFQIRLRIFLIISPRTNTRMKRDGDK